MSIEKPTLKVVNFKLSQDTKDQLDALAHWLEETQERPASRTDALRLAVREAYRTRWPDSSCAPEIFSKKKQKKD